MASPICSRPRGIGLASSSRRPRSRASLPSRLKSIVALLDDEPALLDRIAAHDNLADAVRGAAFVFEAAPEKLDLKQRIFAELEIVVASDTILASNSSAIPSTEIGRHLKHRERVVGTRSLGIRHISCR